MLTNINSVCIVLDRIQTLNTTVAAAYGFCVYVLLTCLHKKKIAAYNAYQYLQTHLMLTNACVHLLLHTGSRHLHTTNWQTYYVHAFMPYLHTPLYLYYICILLGTNRFSGISPCWSFNNSSKMLTAIGAYTGSLSCMLIWYCRNFLYTIGMCHTLYAYLCYVWLL